MGEVWDVCWEYFGEVYHATMALNFSIGTQEFSSIFQAYIDGLVQERRNSRALAMESLQSCTKPSIYYRKVSNIRRALVGNKIVDHSDVVGASPVGAAPTTSSFST